MKKLSWLLLGALGALSFSVSAQRTNELKTIVVDGLSRSYAIHLPKNYRP